MTHMMILPRGQWHKRVTATQANISDKTLAVTARHYDGTLEYNVHNLYGAYEVKATAEALRAIRNKRHFIFTRCADCENCIDLP